MDAKLFQKLLLELQKGKQLLEKKRKEIEATEFISSAGGGLCEIVMNGKFEVIRCTFDDKVVGDKETLQDLVVAAMNELLDRVNEESEKVQKEMQKMLPKDMF